MDSNQVLNLKELAAKYGTDKLEHGYIDAYETFLPTGIKKILEIGCLHGASIRMWREFFPDAEIHCLDLFIENPEPEIEGVTFWKGSQTHPYMLEQLRKENYDLIIDDGSHNSRDQLVSFNSLFGSCKCYVIEDLHCCYEEFYRQRLPFKGTMLGMLLDKKIPFHNHVVNNKIAFIYADES